MNLLLQRYRAWNCPAIPIFRDFVIFRDVSFFIYKMNYLKAVVFYWTDCNVWWIIDVISYKVGIPGFPVDGKVIEYISHSTFGGIILCFLCEVLPYFTYIQCVVVKGVKNVWCRCETSVKDASFTGICCVSVTWKVCERVKDVPGKSFLFQVLDFRIYSWWFLKS